MTVNSSTLDRESRFETLSWALAVAAFLAAATALATEPALALLPLAAFLGWCQLSSV